MDTAEGLEALCLKAGKGSTTIGVELVIEFTDDECVEECSELFFREHDPPLERFNPECARRLGNLQILSLSRNRFSSLEHFRYFSNLLELNLNFNRLTSTALVALQQCGSLQRLFLSSNDLDDACCEFFGAGHFPSLSTLCLYKNYIQDLTRALSFLKAGMRKLRHLDLEGNPCARLQGYRHNVVLGLRCLETLDGDTVTDLDKDLARMFMDKERRRKEKEARAPVRPQTAPSSRGQPKTSPKALKGPTSAKVVTDEGKTTEGSGSEGHAPSTKKRGFASRLRSDTKRHRKLLSIGGQGGGGKDSAKPEVVEGWKEDKEEKEEGYESGHDDEHEGKEQEQEQKPSTTKANEKGNKMATATDRRVLNATILEAARTELPDSVLVDPSDPYQMVQRLLGEIDLLKGQLSDARHRISTLEQNEAAAELGLSVEELAAENKMLQIENKNMYILQQENKNLKDEVNRLEKAIESGASDEADAKGSVPSFGSFGTGRAQDLETENRQLRYELRDVKERFQRLRGACEEDRQQRELERIESGLSAATPRTTFDALGSGSGAGPGGFLGREHENEDRDGSGTARSGESSGPAVSLRADTLLEELNLEDDNDAEVAALIQRNAASLRKIRSDLQKVKRGVVGKSGASSLKRASKSKRQTVKARPAVPEVEG